MTLIHFSFHAKLSHFFLTENMKLRFLEKYGW